MAQDVISTLFGITPRNVAFDKYTEDRMIDVNKAGSQYADLGRANIERASAMMQNAGTGLGIGIGRLLGGQTPQMAEEQRVLGMLGGASLQDPEQLMMAAERFAQAGDIPRAQALQQQAQTLQTARDAKAAADAKAQSAQTAYQNRLRALQSRFPNMPEVEAQALAADEAAFRKLFEDQQIKFSNTVEEISKELFGKPFNQLSSAEARQVNLLKEQREGDKASKGAPKTSLDLGGVFREVYAKEDAKGQAESWKTAGEAYNLQVPIVGKLRQIREALPRTFTGAGAETFLNLGKAMSAFGIPVDPKKLSNTEYFDGVSSQLVQTIAKNFPGSQAIKELEQLIKSKPNFKLEPETITRMLDDLDLELNSNIISYEKLDKLPEKERYQKNPNVVRADTYRQLSRYRELENKARQATKTNPMSKADVEEAIRLKKELGV